MKRPKPRGRAAGARSAKGPSTRSRSAKRPASARGRSAKTPVSRARGRARRAAEIETEAEEHTIQPTAAALEAERTGVLPLQARPSPRSRQIPGHEAETIQAGDADVSPLGNEYSGEEMPGASMPAPDQNRVDDIGRAYGVEEEDTGSLRTSAELLSRRDRRRRE